MGNVGKFIIVYTYYSHLEFPQFKTMRKGKNYNEMFNNIPHFIKNHLHVDYLQDGFVMYKNEEILLKKEVIPPIPDYMIPEDFCQKTLFIINFTTDDRTSKLFFSRKK